jgi:UDP-glucose 4-epimerase
VHVVVTGGAGYIGAHMVRALQRANHDVVVVDNLSTGFRDAVPSGVKLCELDVRDRAALTNLFVTERTEAIFHFASRIQVGESVTDPRLYYRDNLSAAIDLLEAVLDAGVRRFILSSTAAVYGNPQRVPIVETDPTLPVNPYGETKLAIEHALASYARAYGLAYAALRYFNAAGAEPDAGIGERHDPETHLIPLVLEAALGRRPHITIFGEDYPTPDGTCVRDYVHVMDLANAHLLALDHLARGGAGGPFNLGTGSGHSVREVINTAAEVTGSRIRLARGERRPGDPAVLVASPERAIKELGWQPHRSVLRQIIEDAWTWHRSRAVRPA